MTVAAGLDIGNATTEVVLGRLGGAVPEILAYDRVPTRGMKGSPSSVDGAVRLVRRLERECGQVVDVASVAPLRPVTTRAVALPEPTVHTGRLRLVRAGSGTAGGHGTAVAPPFAVGTGAGIPGAPVVAVVPRDQGYAGALPELRRLAEHGVLAGVVLGRDEAVLVANRLGVPVPVVDEVATAPALAAQLLAVEVRGAGQLLRLLTDPVRLAAELKLEPAERAGAVRLAGLLADRSNAVVALDATAPPEPPAPAPWTPPYPVDDLYTVDLGALADGVLARAGSLRSRAVVLAELRADGVADPAPALADLLGRPVRTAPSEAGAARIGGLSTPGAELDAAVVDLGGGTIDVVTGDGSVVVAGAGELLTVAAAGLLGTTRAAAEWAKRGPAYRVEGARILLGEDGSRTFLEGPLGTDAVGALVTAGPGGWLPFHRSLAPGEWRALRLRLKAVVLGGNVARALHGLARVPSTVVVVGGPAGDDEVLACVARELPDGTAVGRGNAAGILGHRFAVAYGLLIASDDSGST
ncbi:MAG TPA: diol dehydratase reactivase ATPase-like domain-containing protein [Rugosimonospora sp.]|nr:diol dehydratase reactivase ATPase-like domain-containing protein [Rugosimonospora sp.]